MGAKDHHHLTQRALVRARLQAKRLARRARRREDRVVEAGGEPKTTLWQGYLD